MYTNNTALLKRKTIDVMKNNTVIKEQYCNGEINKLKATIMLYSVIVNALPISQLTTNQFATCVENYLR